MNFFVKIGFFFFIALGYCQPIPNEGGLMPTGLLHPHPTGDTFNAATKALRSLLSFPGGLGEQYRLIQQLQRILGYGNLQEIRQYLNAISNPNLNKGQLSGLLNLLGQQNPAFGRRLNLARSRELQQYRRFLFQMGQLPQLRQIIQRIINFHNDNELGLGQETIKLLDLMLILPEHIQMIICNLIQGITQGTPQLTSYGLATMAATCKILDKIGYPFEIGGFITDLGMLTNGLGNTMTGLTGGLGGMMGGLTGGLGNTMTGGLGGMMSGLTGGLGNTMTGLTGGLGGMMGGLTGGLGDIMTGLTGGLGGMMGGLTGGLGNTMTGLTGGLGGMMSGLTGGLGNTMTGGLGGMMSGLGGMGQNLGLQDLLGNLGMNSGGPTSDFPDTNNLLGLLFGSNMFGF